MLVPLQIKQLHSHSFTPLVVQARRAPLGPQPQGRHLVTGCPLVPSQLVLDSRWILACSSWIGILTDVLFKSPEAPPTVKGLQLTLVVFVGGGCDMDGADWSADDVAVADWSPRRKRDVSRPMAARTRPR